MLKRPTIVARRISLAKGRVSIVPEVWLWIVDETKNKQRRKQKEKRKKKQQQLERTLQPRKLFLFLLVFYPSCTFRFIINILGLQWIIIFVWVFVKIIVLGLSPTQEKANMFGGNKVRVHRVVTACTSNRKHTVTITRNNIKSLKIY